MHKGLMEDDTLITGLPYGRFTAVDMVVPKSFPAGREDLCTCVMALP